VYYLGNVVFVLFGRVEEDTGSGALLYIGLNIGAM